MNEKEVPVIPTNENQQFKLREYQQGYPNTFEKGGTLNLQFFRGTLKAQPSNLTADEMVNKMKGNYYDLEDCHHYVQWIFPIREQGLNDLAQPLQVYEISEMKKDPVCMKRVMQFYDMMLDFFGISIADPKTGMLVRNTSAKNYEILHHNLQTSSHNYLRITRMLKHLAELGFVEYQIAFLSSFTRFIYAENAYTNCRSCLHGYWLETVRDEKVRFGMRATLDALQPIVILKTIAVKMKMEVLGEYYLCNRFYLLDAASTKEIEKMFQVVIVFEDGPWGEKSNLSELMKQNSNLRYFHFSIDGSIKENLKTEYEQVLSIIGQEPSTTKILFCDATGNGPAAGAMMAILIKLQTLTVASALRITRSFAPFAKPSMGTIETLLAWEPNTGAPSMQVHEYMGFESAEQLNEFLKPAAIPEGGCPVCTYINTSGSRFCKMCNTPLN